uniref:Uncharacterized protein n=1 Tax=Amphimedon queenslandica TaxID=400682 RepID=A0A1X7UGX6_AMPQE
MHLEDILGTDEWFKCKNISLICDLLQLPPVNGRPVINKISHKIVKTKVRAANAVNISKENVEYGEKIINERQKETKLSLKCLILLSMAV